MLGGVEDSHSCLEWGFPAVEKLIDRREAEDNGHGCNADREAQRVEHRLQRPCGWGTEVSPLLWDVEGG